MLHAAYKAGIAFSKSYVGYIHAVAHSLGGKYHIPHGLANAVLLPYVLLTGGFHLDSLDGTGWVCLLVVGLVHTGITYCLYFSSLKELPGQKAAILSYIDPLVAVLVSVLFLQESMTLWQVIGGLLILGFTLWNEITPAKETQ